MADTQHLLVEVRADVLHLTINRPDKRNALSLGLLSDLGAALHAHRHTPVKCAVLTGAGDRCFAAGGDLKELDAIRTTLEARRMSELGHAALDEIRYFPVPVIGAINGLALGGGGAVELALAIVGSADNGADRTVGVHGNQGTCPGANAAEGMPAGVSSRWVRVPSMRWMRVRRSS